MIEEMIEEIVKELTAIREENNLTYQLILKKMDEQAKLFESMLNHLKYIGKELESQTLALQRIEKSLIPSVNSHSLPYPTSPGDLARRAARGEK